MMKRLEKDVAKLLTRQKKTIALAESCTGGLIANRLTNIPGSSKYFKAANIVYSNEAKIKQLKIPKLLIKQKGAVSKEVAIQMAKKIRGIAHATIGLGITGIAGPTGATKTKPLGLVYIALSTKQKQTCKRFNFKGSRLNIKNKSSQAALKLLINHLSKK